MDKIICPHCDQLHDSQAQFCPATGKSLPLSQTCPECGEDVQPGWVACAFCGSKLGKDQTQKPKWWNRYPIRWVIVIIGVLMIPIIAYLVVYKITRDPVELVLNELENLESFQANLVSKDLFDEEKIYSRSEAKFEIPLAGNIKSFQGDNELYEIIYKDGIFCSQSKDKEWGCFTDEAASSRNPVEMWKKIILGEPMHVSATVIDYGYQRVNIEGTKCDSFFLVENKVDADIIQSKHELCFDPKTNLPLMMVQTREVLSNEGDVTSGSKDILNIYAINEPVEINLPPGISPETEEEEDPKPTDHGEDEVPPPESSSIPPLTHSPPLMTGTQVPEPNEVISPENADQIVELARYGRGIVHQVSWLPNEDALEVITSNGIYHFDPNSLNLIDRTNISTHLGSPSIAISPDKHTVALGNLDGTIMIRDANNEETLHILKGPQGQVYILAFSPDGNILASVSDYLIGNEREVLLWDMTTGKKLKSLVSPTNSNIFGLAFSQDGNILAAAPNDGTIRLWDIESGEMIQVLSGTSTVPRSMSFTPDNEYLVTGSRRQAGIGGEGLIQIWDVSNGINVHYFLGGKNVQALELNSEGNIIASGHIDGEIYIWDMDRKQEIMSLSGHTDSITNLAFSSDGNKIASASKDRTVRTWDLATGTQDGIINDFAGQRVTAQSISPNFNSMAISWQKNIYGDSYQEGGFVDIVDLFSGVHYSVIPNYPSWLNEISFSPDERTLALSLHNIVKVWDLVNKRELHSLEGHVDQIDSLEFSPDGKVLASREQDNIIHLWDTATGEELIQLEGDVEGGYNLAFSPDGGIVASGSKNGAIHLWNVITGEQQNTLIGHNTGIDGLVISGDGKRLISSSYDETVRMWDLDKGEEIIVLSGYQGGYFSGDNDLIISPQNKYFAFGREDGSILVGELTTGNEHVILNSQQDRLTNLAFSPDEKILASSSIDGTISIWDMNDGSLLKILTGLILLNNNRVYFSKDGNYLITFSWDGTIRMWGIHP